MITETYNLIILDRSGSMMSIREQAIAGVNETIGTIRSVARHTDMRQFVTLSTFCSCSVNDVYHNDDVNSVKAINESDYEPCCTTPLYDAIGRCCTRLSKEIGDRKDVAVSVTIITDGYENSSNEWNGNAVKKLIESLKKKGWLFAYIGANQDVEEIRYSIAIDNTLSFSATPTGTKKMFAQERKARMRWANSVASCPDADMVCEKNSNYFEE